jgi:hypothetical protein
VNKKTLRHLIIKSLTDQGFIIRDGKILPPENLNKENLRELHKSAVQHKLEMAKKSYFGLEQKFLSRIACGTEVAPEYISPKIYLVSPGSDDELIFRYASLHWSIPVSSGYGRRLRFLVTDRYNDKLIGIFGLCDPVFSIEGRDSWIGWTCEDRKERLSKVMEAYVMGAVPPYSFLLCGKLIAMLATSNEVREAFRRKYEGKYSLIGRRPYQGDLAMLTTNSALGKSSIYNRLSFQKRPLYFHAGFTKGSGEFHFSNGIYKAIFEYASINCKPTAKNGSWGRGFRSRRETIKKCLSAIGLSTEWLYHGIRREIFIVPLAQNTRAFLCGNDTDLRCFDQPADELMTWFRERWLLPRAARDNRYTTFMSSSYRLWDH